MKKLLLTLMAVFTLSVPVYAVSGSAFAVDVFQSCSNGAGGSDVCQDANGQQANNGKNNPIINIIKQAITIISFVIGIAAVIGIVVSGVRIIVAGGDSQAVASARTGLIYSLVGLAVAAVAQAIVAFVLSQVG